MLTNLLLPTFFLPLHRFDIEENLWSQITIPPGAPKPPPMAGHSATVHGDRMIVFGGLQKQRSSIGQFSSSNDVWSFDVNSKSFCVGLATKLFEVSSFLSSPCWAGVVV